MSLAPQKLAPFSALDLDGGERRLRARPPGPLDWTSPVVRRLRRRAERVWQVARRRFARVRQRSLTLELMDGNVTFRTLNDFEVALAAKTDFPLDKIPDLAARPAEDLRRVATHIRQVEKRFAQVLTESIQEPAFIGELLREVEIKLFSNDHGWRDLVEALNLHGPEFDEHKKLVLVMYMQYLGSRQDALRSLYLDKTRDRDATKSGLYASPPLLPMSQACNASLHDTGVFPSPDAASSDEAFAALPRGETVSACLNGGELELELAGHRFWLRGGESFQLVDEAGELYDLAPGKNLIGRSTAADVVVSGWLRGVSRRHVILEPVSEDEVLITDISSHGTAVPERLLD